MKIFRSIGVVIATIQIGAYAACICCMYQHGPQCHAYILINFCPYFQHSARPHVSNTVKFRGKSTELINTVLILRRKFCWLVILPDYYHALSSSPSDATYPHLYFNYEGLALTSQGCPKPLPSGTNYVEFPLTRPAFNTSTQTPNVSQARVVYLTGATHKFCGWFLTILECALLLINRQKNDTGCIQHDTTKVGSPFVECKYDFPVSFESQEGPR